MLSGKKRSRWRGVDSGVQLAFYPHPSGRPTARPRRTCAIVIAIRRNGDAAPFDRRRRTDTIQETQPAHLRAVGDPEILTQHRHTMKWPIGCRSAFPILIDIAKSRLVTKCTARKPGSLVSPTLSPARRLVERACALCNSIIGGGQSRDRQKRIDIRFGMLDRAAKVDQPAARPGQGSQTKGALDETRVVWGGEFGRTPMNEAGTGRFIGRDHHPHAFSIGWRRRIKPA